MTAPVKLTAAQRRALLTPISGYCLGSNMWPLVALMDDDGKEICGGEEIDALLRAGLFDASPLPKPVFVEHGGGDIPDNEVTHALNLTAAGRAALAHAEGEGR